MTLPATAVLGAANVVIANPGRDVPPLPTKETHMTESATAVALPQKGPNESIMHFARRSAFPAAKEFGKAAVGLGVSALLSGWAQSRLARASIQGTTALGLMLFRQGSMAMGAGLNAVRSLIGAVVPSMIESDGMLDGVEDNLVVGELGDEFDDLDALMGIGEEFDDYGDYEEFDDLGEPYEDEWGDEYDALDGADDIVIR